MQRRKSAPRTSPVLCSWTPVFHPHGTIGMSVMDSVSCTTSADKPRCAAGTHAQGEHTSAVSFAAAAFATLEVVTTVRKLKKRLLNMKSSVLRPTAPSGAVPSRPMMAVCR